MDVASVNFFSDHVLNPSPTKWIAEQSVGDLESVLRNIHEPTAFKFLKSHLNFSHFIFNKELYRKAMQE